MTSFERAFARTDKAVTKTVIYANYTQSCQRQQILNNNEE